MFINNPILIIILILLFLFLISSLIGLRKKQLAKKAEKEFRNFALLNHLTIDKVQTLHKNRIAIDKENSKLIFIEKSKNPHNHLIDLTEVSYCKLLKTKNPQNGHIHTISLQCNFIKDEKPPILLPIYQENRDPVYKMMRLSKKAMYWKKTINLFKEMPSKRA